jgi:uncharacterized protein YbcC (UPF0753/DUF2309 family)
LQVLFIWFAILLVSDQAINSHLSQIHHYSFKEHFRKQITYFSKNVFHHSRDKLVRGIEHQIEELKKREQLFQKNLFLKMEKTCLHEITSVKKECAQFQFVFCMDDREESIRRHVETSFPEGETLSVPGHFFISMLFKTEEHLKPIPLCPPFVTSTRLVTLEKKNKHFFQYMTLYLQKKMWSNHLISILMGCFSYFFLWSKILFPFLYKKTFSPLGLAKNVSSHPTQQLIYEGEQGFPFEECVEVVRTFLRHTSLHTNCAPYVVIISHGSSMQNNPFVQAYGCGACGGYPGLRNAQLFCLMANRQDISKVLSQEGYIIPTETQFLAAHHDTCAEDLFFTTDLELNCDPSIIKRIKQGFLESTYRNARERSLRFPLISQELSSSCLYKQIQKRAEDIAQPRPEYGHNGVSLYVLGRRERFKQHSFDRQAFMVSYDPDQDPHGDILNQMVSFTLPVAVNITMDYFFSSFSPESFGAGSKLPLNITGLLGVMTGSKSDYRIGLVKEMIEDHLPKRLVCIIEAEKEIIEKTLQQQKRLKTLLFHEWFFLYQLCPKTWTLSYYQKGTTWVPSLTY